MAAFEVGDRVLILKPLPGVWQKVGTIQQVWKDDRDESRCLYEVKVDGQIWRVRGRHLELLLSQGAA
jgi:hypothetical protein